MDFQYKRKLSHTQSKIMVYQDFDIAVTYNDVAIIFSCMYIPYTCLYDFRIPVEGVASRIEVKIGTMYWHHFLQHFLYIYVCM